jgi:hypothetical protein
MSRMKTWVILRVTIPLVFDHFARLFPPPRGLPRSVMGGPPQGLLPKLTVALHHALNKLNDVDRRRNREEVLHRLEHCGG